MAQDNPQTPPNPNPQKTHLHSYLERIGLENHSKMFSSDPDITPEAIDSQIQSYYTQKLVASPEFINPIKQNAVSEFEKTLNDNLRIVFGIGENELNGLTHEQKLKLAQAKQVSLGSQTDGQRVLKIQELEAAKIAQEQIIKNIETTYESKLKEAESRMYISQIAGSQQLTNDLRNVMPGLMLHLQTNYQISWNEKSQTVEFLTKSGSVVLDDSLRNMKSEDIILDALKKTKFIKVNQTAGGNTGGGSRLNLDKINQPLNNNNNQPDHRIPNLTKAEQHLANMVKGYGNN